MTVIVYYPDVRQYGCQTNMVDKIYHFHIPKTAGTSLNEWLDDCVSFERARPANWHGPLLAWYQQKGIGRARACRSVTMACWDVFDVIHDHKNILPLRPPNSVCVTVLRDPVERVISGFNDFSRLVPSDFAHRRPVTVAFQTDCLAMSFAELYRKWGARPVFRFKFEDLACRLLLTHEVGPRRFLRMEPRERFVRALAVLKKQIDAVGIFERMDETLDHFSRVLGLYPRRALPRLNIGGPMKTEITAEDRRRIETINVGDRMLYDCLAETFNARDVGYSVETFEADRLLEAMRRIDIHRRAGETIYEAKDALIGDGFWGRDSRGKPDCCRWSGPGDDSVLYVHSSPARNVKVSLDVRGWLSPEARSEFRVKVWGRPVEHRFRPGENLADIVEFGAAPRGEILKLEFHAPAKTDDECGHPESDGRRKGFLMNRIVVMAA